MTNSSDGLDKQPGLLVMDELPFSISPNLFIKLLILPKKYFSQVSAKWRKSKDNEIEISLEIATYIYPDGNQICLYCFPEAIGRPFEGEEYEAPVETIGFLVIVDIERLLQLNQKVSEKHSAIYWAKSYHLPIIIAVNNSTKIEKSIDILSQFIDYSPDMPIVWCDGEMDLDCVERVMDTIYSYI